MFFLRDSSHGNSMELNLRTDFDFKFLKWMAPFSFHALHLFCWLSQEAGLLKLNFLIVRKTWLYYSCFPGILLLNIRILSTNMVFSADSEISDYFAGYLFSVLFWDSLTGLMFFFDCLRSYSLCFLILCVFWQQNISGA
jgi:hypothetical protein